VILADTSAWVEFDCMIAAVSWRSRATLLACDADMDRVAQVMGIEMDGASLGID